MFHITSTSVLFSLDMTVSGSSHRRPYADARFSSARRNREVCTLQGFEACLPIHFYYLHLFVQKHVSYFLMYIESVITILDQHAS